MAIRGDATLDEALEALELYAPEFAGRLSNHGPMVADALGRLGRSDEIASWIDWYIPRLEERWALKERVNDENWREALGQKARFADWREFFQSKIEQGPWREVVGLWSGVLAPGLSGSATHGIIRTGHAVHALEVTETPQRLRELCSALSYWASVYQRLPEASSPRRVGLATALLTLPELPSELQARTGWEHSVAEMPSFAGVIDLVQFGATPGEALSEMTETFARVYLANAALRGRVVIPIHAVTSAVAARKLVPYVDVSTASQLVRYVWQAGAAICTAFSADRRPLEVMESAYEWDDLADQAVSSKDEHAIKFVEACKSEHALNAQACFLEAAADACARLAREA